MLLEPELDASAISGKTARDHVIVPVGSLLRAILKGVPEQNA
jgi:hypothetical protein